MTQRTTGIYRLVTNPSVYQAIQATLSSTRVRKFFVQSVVRASTGARVLDVGCGPGSLFSYLPAVSYVGYDLNRKHIEHAQRTYSGQAEFVHGDAVRDLPIAADFDVVILSALLHHLDDEEANELLRSALRLVRCGGRIVTIDPVWLPEQHFVAKILNALDSGRNIRDTAGYLMLLEGVEVITETCLLRNMMRIPYDLYCMTITRIGRPEDGAAECGR